MYLDFRVLDRSFTDTGFVSMAISAMSAIALILWEAHVEQRQSDARTAEGQPATAPGSPGPKRAKHVGKINITLVSLFLSLAAWFYFAGTKHYGDGRVDLTADNQPKIDAIRAHLAQGMTYARQHNFQEAVKEFREAEALDKHYLQVHQDIAAAEIALGESTAAEKALEAEQEVTDCLKKMPEDDEYVFRYFVNDEDNKNKAGAIRDLREAVDRVQADIHYDRACLRSLRNDKVGALAELREAVHNHFSDKEAIEHDHDLDNIRHSPEFATILHSISTANQ